VKLSDIIENIRALKIKHYTCEDTYYSCPMSGECSNEFADEACDCNADDHNARVDQIISDLITQQETQNEVNGD
jgi:hypothetical protein